MNTFPFFSTSIGSSNVPTFHSKEKCACILPNNFAFFVCSGGECSTSCIFVDNIAEPEFFFVNES